MSKNIVLIRFSLREEGNCAAITARINNYYAAERVSSFVVDNNTIHPCSNCNYECLRSEKICPNLTDDLIKVMNAICEADLTYYVVPNYCGYPCANYFAFNERSVGYFNMDRALMQKYMEAPKRFIVVSNTEGQNFEMAMQQQTISKPEILYLKTGKYGKQSIAGDLMGSGAAKTDLDVFLDQYPF